MNRMLYFVFPTEIEGQTSSGTLGIYLDDPEEALKHSARVGGRCISVVGNEIRVMDDIHNTRN